MNKFKCVASSIRPDRNGNAFTLESIKKFENLEKPILVNYDQSRVVGRVTDAEVVDGKLIVSGELVVDITDLFVAPSFRSIDAYVEPDSDTLVHTNIEVMSYGLTTSHSDYEATPVEFLKED
ncbi:hypothetical protein VPT02_120 [Vibrio phage VPT02]|uniref:Uncharacterized protein n=1 Tax=Vibrio phage pVp-1 TaxID=1150989 RepID=H6WXB4_9CAUD|nr:hypothetical protein F404_gp023 [Vibrio phage pVp-1]AFB83880.1 hypothetical protein pVp-1_0023 [Vibrio phage pVp-1]QIG60696.1 hypothetical protein VPT02_120 [Vibrio phage VPT02]